MRESLHADVSPVHARGLWEAPTLVVLWLSGYLAGVATTLQGLVSPDYMAGELWEPYTLGSHQRGHQEDSIRATPKHEGAATNGGCSQERRGMDPCHIWQAGVLLQHRLR